MKPAIAGFARVPLGRSGVRPWRWAFSLALLWGALLPWVARHPPMIDLPQHAAQIALWNDLLQGRSAWQDQFRINYLTPYLIGYGIALPLSWAVGVLAALKLMLSGAYLAFVLLGSRIRARFGADERLDWLLPAGFFGFAFKWGLFTFLVAAPLALLFILFAERYAREGGWRQAAKVAFGGALLLASHGLVFLYAVTVGAAVHLVRNHTPGRLARTVWPYLLLGALCGLVFFLNRQFNAAMPNNLDAGFRGDWGLHRVLQAVVYTVVPNQQPVSMLLPAAIAGALFCLPWLMGLRINRKNPAAIVPFAVTALILAVVPSGAFSTALLYQRFAMFLLPAYAWMFAAAELGTAPRDRLGNAGLALLPCLLIFLLFGSHTARSIGFDRETAGIDQAISRLDPGRRALSLILDRNSAADGGFKTYVHYPAWYQAERHGLVDFNFAWFPPQIVRYRIDRLPPVAVGFEWNPHRFDWHRNGGQHYRYFFIRHTDALPDDLFRGAVCQPRRIIAKPPWSIYENAGCGESPHVQVIFARAATARDRDNAGRLPD